MLQNQLGSSMEVCKFPQLHLHLMLVYCIFKFFSVQTQLYIFAQVFLHIYCSDLQYLQNYPSHLGIYKLAKLPLKFRYLLTYPSKLAYWELLPLQFKNLGFKQGNVYLKKKVFFWSGGGVVLFGGGGNVKFSNNFNRFATISHLKPKIVK